MPLQCEVVAAIGIDGSLVAPVRRVIERSAEIEPSVPRGTWAVVVRLTDDGEISRAHAAYFGDPSPTDVISFPSGDELDRKSGYLGDIMISVETAGKQATSEGHSVLREVAFLALHGLLHLCGHDDRADEDREKMLARQSELLELLEETPDEGR